MTLTEKLKQAEASAEALRRELEVEQACGFAAALARATDAETAVTAAKEALANAEQAWTCHKVAGSEATALTKEREARGGAIWRSMRDCDAALRNAAAARDAALEDLKAAARAAAAVAARVTAETDRSLPKWSGY
jgi:hypothetical protein